MKRVQSFIAALIFFSLILPSPVFAAPAVTLPESYYHEGLTFDQPLTFLNQEEIPLITLIFGLTKTTTTPATPTPEPTASLTPTTTITPTPTKIATILSPTPTASVNKQPTAVPTIIPSATPIPPTATPIPPASYQLSTGGGLNADKLFDMSNAFRAGKGLPPFQKDDRTCALAASRAPEVNAEVESGTMHSGLRARNLPYWNTENIISFNSEEGAFNWWINDQIHYDAIVGNYTYSCVACAGYACAQEFTNYQPK